MTTERKQQFTEIVARAWARQEVSGRLADPVLAGAIVAQLMEELPSIEPNPVATAIADLAGRVGESVDGLKAALQEHAEMMARQEAGKA